MTLLIFGHIGLAIILFFAVNFIGQHSPASFGYYQLTTFLETEEAPAFNFLLRVLTPVVFLIVVSAFLYAVHLDRFTTNIFLVSVYYVLFRSVFNIAINRAVLINWPKQAIYSISIVGLSYMVYKKIIITKSNVLPDFNNLANELWIIIILFLYSLVNNMSIASGANQKRKDRYVQLQFNAINRKYSPIILKQTKNVRLRQIALAIIIYESFNRPKLFRMIEYVNHYFNRKPHTLGIMQFKTIDFINDDESVRLGTRKLVADSKDVLKNYLQDDESYVESEYKDSHYQQKLVEKYNPDLSYSYEVIQLADELNKKYFSNGPTLLFNQNDGASFY